ncbi:hypothetical protein CKO51_29410 [Rhodopirellula sp. SM50]|nr:hypothetical protein CKO51_29410 [Rhodopirellula sp. SM50]
MFPCSRALPSAVKDFLAVGREPSGVNDFLAVGREPSGVYDFLAVGREPSGALAKKRKPEGLRPAAKTSSNTGNKSFTA